MTLYKSGTCLSSIVIATSVYSCTSCDHTEILKGEKDHDKKCPECQSDMIVISSSAEAIENPVNSKEQ